MAEEDHDTTPGAPVAGGSGLVFTAADLPLVAARTLSEAAAGGIGALGLAWAARQAGLPDTLLFALGGLLVLYALRVLLAGRGAELRPSQRPAAALLFTLGLALTALAWGGIGAYAATSAGSGPMLYLVAAVVSLVALAAITAYTGLAATGYAFITLALAPAAVGCFMTGGPSGFGCAGAMAATGVLAFYLVQQFASLRASQRDHERRCADLENTLDQRQQQIETLTASVRAHEKKERELEADLRKASADLGLVQNKTRLLSETIQRISTEDAATSLANAHHFAESLKLEWSRMRRSVAPLTLMRIQLDEFKDYQSNYGAKALDRCLGNVAEVIRQNGRRPGDCAARIGAYDFALLLPGADSASAMRIAERIRIQVLELKYPNRASTVDTVTASVGLATVVPDAETPIPELQRRCDSALHEAEFQGGNTVVRYRSLETIGLEAWNPDEDGRLSQQTISAKLRRRGLKPIKKTQPGPRYLIDKRLPVGYAFGVLKGRLKVAREGQTAVLGPGDCWIVKAGAVISAEAAGSEETICIEAAEESQSAAKPA